LSTTLSTARLFVMSSAICAGLVACSGSDDDDPPAPPPVGEAKIHILSSDPSMASGGDALVSIDVPSGVSPQDVSLQLNGAAVTDQLQFDPASGTLRGVVQGMAEGANTLTAAVPGGATTTLTVTNYPSTGQIFGPHQRPWICETEASGLGAPPAVGPCTAETRYDWFYRTTAGTFAPLPSPTRPFPADLAQTTTTEGQTVDYIVRVESGVIDESIYRIAILDDPTREISNPWSPGGTKPGAGWNGKLSYPLTGGANPGFRSGRNVVTSALQDIPLSLGFAVAFGTRNVLGTGNDDLVSAESMMMIKERFIEQYGVPRFTIGSGTSGAAIQQHLISQNYPGLLDALTLGISYPDVVSLVDIIDCHILRNYFDSIAEPAAWPGERRSKVDGYAVATNGPNAGTTVCQTGWAGRAEALQDADGSHPTVGFDAAVPLNLRYDPVNNPTGARGTLWDANVLSIGIDPATGFARSLYDNVGVQYGFKAVNRGDITVAEFLDLNEKIGGRDVDGNLIPQRSVGDKVGIANAFRYGRIATGENWTLPMIYTRDYRDFNNDIHTRERDFAALERMRMATGTTENTVTWTVPVGEVPGVNLARMALLAHNQWLENILADTSSRSYAEKVIANKPADAKDACWDAAGTKTEEAPTLDPSAACNQLFPVHENTRLAAGGPISAHILKCQLKPVDAADYAVPFTPQELDRLRAIFPEGVCDWSKSGVGERQLEGTRFRFTSPGVGVSMPPAQQ
jgi:hypothetical protein